jgi:HlyD family secretion protein
MRRTPLIYGTVAVVVLVIAAAAYRAAHEPALQVVSAAATRGTISREVLTSGVLEPKDAVDTGTQVSGTIQALHADFNSPVKAGEVIAQIDPSTYDTALAEARAGEIQARANAQRLQVELDDLSTKARRAVQLAESGLLTQAELDAAQLAAKQAAAALTAASADVRVAQASVRMAEVNRARTTIRAPMDGIVVSRNVEVGQTVAASFSSPVLFRIANLAHMQLLAEIGESEAASIKAGVPVTFQIESMGSREFKGVVSELRLDPVYEKAGSTGTSGSSGNAAATPTGTSGAAAATSAPQSTSLQSSGATSPSVPSGSVVSYTAVVDVDNTDRSIAPGTTAIVTLPTAHRDDVVRVPNAALAFKPNADVIKASGQEPLKLTSGDADAGRVATTGYVWKYEAGKFVPIAVGIGASDERWTEVTGGGVEPGDELVTQVSLPRR